jgi:hypothetical protein
MRKAVPMSDLPTVAQPRAVASASRLLAERRADLADAERRVQESAAGIELARAEDRALLAAALDRGDPDPGTAREDEARLELEAAERRADAERPRVGRAQDEFDRTLHEQLDGWRAAIEKTIGKLDDQALEAVDVLARVEAERSDARGARVWLEWLARGEQPPKTLMVASPPTSHQVNRNDPRCLSLDDVIGLARGAIERSTLVAQREQAAERAREEAEYERRSAELRVRTGRL